MNNNKIIKITNNYSRKINKFEKKKDFSFFELLNKKINLINVNQQDFNKIINKKYKLYQLKN